MRKIVVLLLAVTLVFNVAGCSSKEDEEESTEEEEEKMSFNETQEIKDQITEDIESNLPNDGLFRILGEDWLSVYVSTSGNVSIRIRATAPYAIPYVARDLIPVVKDAMEGIDLELQTFEIQSYSKNNDGIITETLADWNIKNYESGIYVSEPDGYHLAGVTLDDLFELYADYDELVTGIMNGEYD